MLYKFHLICFRYLSNEKDARKQSKKAQSLTGKFYGAILKIPFVGTCRLANFTKNRVCEIAKFTKPLINNLTANCPKLINLDALRHNWRKIYGSIVQEVHFTTNSLKPSIWMIGGTICGPLCR